MATVETLIVGAGMAGLACARALADAGQTPVVLDKGRGIGGRLATRRTEAGFSFDHGAQYVTAKSDGFRTVLDDMRRAGAACYWQDGSDRAHIVGVPGMNALAKHLATGIEVHPRTEVTAIAESATGWEVVTAERRWTARRLVLTPPAPQCAALLGPDHALRAGLDRVKMTPCLTLMAAFDPGQPRPYAARRDAEDVLSWIAQNNTKPGRNGEVCWVAQASPAWSAAHLEEDKDEIARRMLGLLCDRLGIEPSATTYLAGHRWRYAAVAEPLGAPFLKQDRLWLGGDWCLAARVEAAWTSGTAIARDILGG